MAASARSEREKNSNQERKDKIRERERAGVNMSPVYLVNKQIIKEFGMAVRTVSYLRRYCSMFQIFETFRTADEI